MKLALPSTPRELWTLLGQMFPDFLQDFTPDDIAELERDPAPSFHSVMSQFTQYFGCISSTSSERQLKMLAELINRGVAEGGDLETAISTCFLEHLRQIRANRVLAPHLSRAAKERTRA